jgi:acetyltransferase-like isoleucine patch superfamily enzyme
VAVLDQNRTSSGVSIGEGAWIGAGAKILDGVTIGAHAVIGAGAVVRDHVPSRAIAVGVPARIVSSRASAEP